VLIIEHPFRSGWKLVDTQKPLETTPSVYRFKGTAQAGKVSTLLVKEELTTSETISMLTTDVAQLVTFSKTAQIPSRIRDAITKAVQLKQAMEEIERQRSAHDRELAEITAEQTRIRENMKTVAPSTQYYERLLTKLNEQESSIERLQKERDALAIRRDAARKELEEYLDGLTLE
jgi:chromosome segregation ATPase